ncbi:uncharacterized protein LOC125678237 [Ostrea edulis]|uniref:uncharacterized protein LOC125678237 n=1 Tax=Ostrea edulis TaxID=37623 RepID=UPI0024AEB48A|nr:uncharacterized protein LOC125678237 [Ostrea edulis]
MEVVFLTCFTSHLSNFADVNMESHKLKRKPNWSSEESLALTTLVEEYKDVVRGKLSPQLTSQMKSKAWGEIAVKLRAMSVGPTRTAAEVEKKWHNIFSKTKTEISNHRRIITGTGGGPPPKSLSAVAEAVTSVIGANNTYLMGIEGGIDTSLLNLDIVGDESVGIHVIEGPPDTDPHILGSTPLEVTSVLESSLPLVTSGNSSRDINLKRKMEELTCRKLELEVQYLEMKIRKLKKEE